jgi:hypothetical protein
MYIIVDIYYCNLQLDKCSVMEIWKHKGHLLHQIITFHGFTHISLLCWFWIKSYKNLVLFIVVSHASEYIVFTCLSVTTPKSLSSSWNIHFLLYLIFLLAILWSNLNNFQFQKVLLKTWFWEINCFGVVSL